MQKKKTYCMHRNIFYINLTVNTHKKYKTKAHNTKKRNRGKKKKKNRKHKIKMTEKQE